MMIAALSLPGWVVRAQDELIVFAAASLTDAFEAIAEAYEAEYPDVQILFNFGGSSTLAAQIVQGAPADVFASANPQQMQVVIEAERIADEPIIFAQNALVLVVPADNPAEIESVSDLGHAGVALVLAAPDVPIRAYADVVFDRLADDPDFGEGYREAVLANLVSEEPNVRQVMAKIALGEADAGIVYASDVTPDLADAVQVIDIPDEINVVATYPIALMDDTPRPERAQHFVNFVVSQAGQAILNEWGFRSILAPPAQDAETTPEPEATQATERWGACDDRF